MSCAQLVLSLLLATSSYTGAYTFRYQSTLPNAAELAAQDAYAPNVTFLKHDGEHYRFSGSGVLISPNVVVTAKHNIDADTQYFLGFGNNAQAVLETLVAVSEILEHPNSNLDIALLVLEQNIYAIAPAVLGTEIPEERQWLTTAGLGPSSYIGHNDYIWDFVKRATVNRIRQFGPYFNYGSQHAILPFASRGMFVHPYGSSPVRGNSGDGAYAISDSLVEALRGSIEIPGRLPLVGIVRGIYGIEFDYSEAVILCFSQFDKEWMQGIIDERRESWSPHLDSDGDLYNDYYEFVFGGDPTSSEVVPPALIHRMEEIDGQEHLSIYFLRRTTLPANEKYFVSQSADLVNWEDHYSPMLTTVVDANLSTPPAGCEWVRFSVETEGKSQFYLRVGVGNEQ